MFTDKSVEKLSVHVEAIKLPSKAFFFYLKTVLAGSRNMDTFLRPQHMFSVLKPELWCVIVYKSSGKNVFLHRNRERGCFSGGL